MRLAGAARFRIVLTMPMTRLHLALARCLLVLSAAACGLAQDFYTCIGNTGTHSALIAWGRVGGPGNTIGRTASPAGAAEVRIDGQSIRAQRSWLLVTGLEPDREYPYEIWLDGKQAGSGWVRTLPEKTNRLAFVVIGDYGNASRAQRELAQVMEKEVRDRSRGPNPVRFVLTTGDNVYADLFLGFIPVGSSGSEDRHWGTKFFQPYREILRRVPVYPTLGNHDGNGSESRGDLATYLDNFFFPGGEPVRYYTFGVGGLAEFFALDSTENSESGSSKPVYLENGDQSRWLREQLSKSRAPWKIPYFHHPPFSAGPRHEASLGELNHWVKWFAEAGVKVAFSGHEHNFQFSRNDAATGGVRYVVTGAGGSLRKGDPRDAMVKAGIEGWAAVPHFLLVEIEDRTMTVTPKSNRPVEVVDHTGKGIPMPLTIKLAEK